MNILGWTLGLFIVYLFITPHAAVTFVEFATKENGGYKAGTKS